MPYERALYTALSKALEARPGANFDLVGVAAGGEGSSDIEDLNESLTFNDLKELLATSDGNLSVHARKLEDAGYVDCRKTFEERHPKTEYRLTARGRKALERYLDHMEALIQATRG